MLTEGREVELALDPLYEAFDDVTVHAHLSSQQCWAVRVTGTTGAMSVIGAGHGWTLIEALRVAAGCALRAGDIGSRPTAPGTE